MAGELEPDLFISLNDYELSLLSEGLAQELRNLGTVVPILEAYTHSAVADKYEMARKLHEHGISTPKTALVSDIASAQRIILESENVIVKDRYGSGSSGLRSMTQQQAERWLESVQVGGNEDLDLENLILQPRQEGVEYGLDIVTPLTGGLPEALFARKKLAMRHGETSSAVTVSPERFAATATSLATVLGTKGIVDIDIYADDDEMSVIDINPRFGGGYPFVHLAGADVPSFFVRSLSNIELKQGWNEYVSGMRVAKHEGIISFGAESGF